jgi:SAM-dependent methyltransferase
MADLKDMSLLFRLAVKERRYPSVQYLQSYLEYVFAGTGLNGARVLDIGGGSGIISFYAACCGAADVVCLEPAAAGSAKGITEIFRRWASELQVSAVKLRGETFDAYDPGGSLFDVVVLHHSINHLAEDACINIRKDGKAMEIYIRIFKRLAEVCRPGGTLLISDCSCYNMFPLLGLRNRFVPSIEWHKHQPPSVWTHMLRDAGFADVTVRWDRFAGVPVGPVGAFFLTSHFCITAKR